MIPSERRLDIYARLAVEVGLNLQSGQKLIVLAPLEAAPLVRAVAERAYRRGARLVEVLWRDGALLRIRHDHAPSGSFEATPRGRIAALDRALEDDAAVLSLSESDPALLEGVDPVDVATRNRATAQALDRYNRVRGEQRLNWSLIGAPTAAWARTVFPERDDDAALAALWDAVLRAVRIDRDDPLAAWDEHLSQLGRALEHLNDRRYDAVHLRADGTDLTVGLPDGHRWTSAHFTRRDGLPFVANLPSEEVFTSPHAERTEGTVQATKPLVYNGTRIEGFGMRFEGGRVVEHWAERGAATLQGILDADAGARRLGEIALVPHGSPISQSGLLFHNTLFDENAASHIALGRGFPFALHGERDRADADAAGVNDSALHVDFMIGSGAMDVDGVTADGRREAVMRDGEWAFGDASRADR